MKVLLLVALLVACAYAQELNNECTLLRGVEAVRCQLRRQNAQSNDNDGFNTNENANPAIRACVNKVSTVGQTYTEKMGLIRNCFLGSSSD